MKRSLLAVHLAAAIVLSGSPLAAAEMLTEAGYKAAADYSAQRIAPATGPLRVLASNPRYFTDGSGKAIFLTGSHTWANFAVDFGDSDPPGGIDYEGFLDFLVAHNHNFFRGWLWDVPFTAQGNNGGPFHYQPYAWLRTGTGMATDGKPKFDLTKFNQAYFDRLRSRVIAARDRGLYVSVMLFQGYALQFNRNPRDGFAFDGRNNINGLDAGPGHAAHTLEFPAVTTAQEDYVRKVIDTVNDLDNVLYEIANEAGPYSTAWQYHMINFIHRYERTKPKQHPVGMTLSFKGGTDEELFASPADWISPDYSKSYIKDPPTADGRKVVVVDSDHCYGWRQLKKDGPAEHQAWAWKNFLRGNLTLFMDPYLAKIAGNNVGRNHPTGAHSTEPYYGITPDPYWETLRVAMGRTRIYAEKMDLASMTPRLELASTRYCLANPGLEYLVYKPAGAREFTVTVVGGAYSFEWYDPTHGKVVNTGRLDASDSARSFAAPFGGDAVLYLKKAR